MLSLVCGHLHSVFFVGGNKMQQQPDLIRLIQPQSEISEGRIAPNPGVKSQWRLSSSARTEKKKHLTSCSQTPTARGGGEISAAGGAMAMSARRKRLAHLCDALLNTSLGILVFHKLLPGTEQNSFLRCKALFAP